MNNLQRRIDKLDQRVTELSTDAAKAVVIYDPSDPTRPWKVEPGPEPGRVIIYLPDNGRDPELRQSLER